MSKSAYTKIAIAGPLRKVTRYSRALPRDSIPVRRAKEAATTEAQRFINIKNATERLELLFWANFSTKDSHFLTFTFDNEHLPANQAHVKKYFASYLRFLGKAQKAKGRDWRYIYTVEGDSAPDAAPVAAQEWEVAPWRVRKQWEEIEYPGSCGGRHEQTRLHVHCFMRLDKSDYETVRELWPYGTVHISAIQVDKSETFSRLASYVTKESRNGEKGTGSRAYIPSKGLEQPVITGYWCSEEDQIEIPVGAKRIKHGSTYNDTYGSYMEYISYILPPATVRAKSLHPPQKKPGTKAK